MVQVVQSLLEGMAGSAGQREVATLTTELIPILIETTGSTNARLAAAASENLLHLAGEDTYQCLYANWLTCTCLRWA